jgi:hypothetical protein
MDGDFYTTLRWRLLRGFMLWFYGRRCMRCGSAYRVEVDHIIARARGEFGREYQWMPRNLQILCREHNQEKMTKFDDWRPLWARVLMPVRDTGAAHYAGTLAALSPDEYRGFYATTPLHVVEVGRSYPLTVPRQDAAILRWPAQQPRTRRPEQALAFAENYGQADDTRVGCWRCPDGGVGFSAYSADCRTRRRLQMALVKRSSKLAPWCRVAEVDSPERHGRDKHAVKLGEARWAAGLQL